MSTPRFEDMLNQIVAATVAALNAAGITAPSQVGIGWPVSTELVKILNAGGYQVTVQQRQGSTRSTARHPTNAFFTITNPAATLVASVANPTGFGAPWTIAVSGSAGTGGAFVNVLVGAQLTVAKYTAAPNESLATSVAGIAAAINALGVSGLMATVSGDNVLVTGTPLCTVGVTGTSGVIAQEVNRLACSVQVSVWAPNTTIRFAARDAIESAVGTVLAPFVTLSDGTQAYCVLVGGAQSGPDDSSQSSYSLYAEHLVFEVEYGVLKVQPGYPIAVVDATLTTPSGDSLAAISGGPA